MVTYMVNGLVNNDLFQKKSSKIHGYEIVIL
jgi:hypothetical protein